MASTITHFRCLLISPGDMQDERDALRQVCLSWNAHMGKFLGASVELTGWETHTTPASGARPQEIINEQIVDEAAFGIALFWTRLGTPTGQAPSGSAEEIARLTATKKRVMIYFKTSDIRQSAANEEFQRLQDFKKEMQSTGLCFDFDSVFSLREQVLCHMNTTVAELLRLQPNEYPARTMLTSPRLVNLVDPFVYQMRRNVYDGLQKFLADFTPRLQVSMEMIAQLHKLREDSEFLFGPEVVVYIREWIKHAVNVHVGREVIDNPVPSSPDYQGWLQVYHEACQYLAHQPEPLINIFRPYLRH